MGQVVVMKQLQKGLYNINSNIIKVSKYSAMILRYEQNM